MNEIAALAEWCRKNNIGCISWITADGGKITFREIHVKRDVRRGGAAALAVTANADGSLYVEIDGEESHMQTAAEWIAYLEKALAVGKTEG